jgi:hypothetical protein
MEAEMAVTQVVLVDQTHQIDPGLLHNAAIALDTTNARWEAGSTTSLPPSSP